MALQIKVIKGDITKLNVECIVFESLSNQNRFASEQNVHEQTYWLGMRDSNPRMPGPKPGALPLGQSPM